MVRGLRRNHEEMTLVRAFLCFGLLGLLGCDAPELPREVPKTATASAMPQRVTPPPPPLAPNVWSADLRTFGGFGGAGKGWIDVRSDRKVSPCRTRIPEDKWLALESAIASAEPREWREAYRPTRFRQTDAFSYSLGLEIDKTRYHTNWNDNSDEQIPDDVRALYEALDDLLDHCR